jgi:hypothetical protein
MDLNFGYGTQVTPNPNQFAVPTGLGVSNTSGYGAINSFGMGSPTLGASTDSTAGVLGGSAIAGSSGLGANLPTLQLGLSGLSTLANLYTGIQALGLAKNQFSFQKDLAQKNYNNSVSTYNTSLEDRANARASVTGQSAADTQAYINAHKLA